MGVTMAFLRHSRRLQRSNEVQYKLAVMPLAPCRMGKSVPINPAWGTPWAAPVVAPLPFPFPLGEGTGEFGGTVKGAGGAFLDVTPGDARSWNTLGALLPIAGGMG